MMTDVGISDVVEEEVSEETVVPIDGAEGASEPSPFGIVEMGHSGVGVLQFGDEDQPEVDDKVRNSIYFEQEHESVVISVGGEHRDPNEEGGVADQNFVPMFGGVDGRRRFEVVDSTPVLFVIMVTSTTDIGGQIDRPAQQEHEDGAKGDTQGGSAQPASERLVGGGLPRRHVTALGWNKDFVVVKVTSVLVVACVRQAPRVVRDEQRRMQNQTDDVVESLRRGEGAVTALVGAHPDAGKDGALPDPIYCPK